MTRSRTKLAVAALVAALVAWFVTPMIVGQQEFNGIPAAQEDATEEPTPEATEAPDISIEELLGGLPVETHQVFLARDPFQPVLPESSGGGDGSTGGGGGGGDGDPTDPTDPTDPGGGPVDPNDETCNVGSNSATCEGLTVTLLDVQGDKIIVQVDDTLYEVTVGSVFAGSFEVMSITAPCADLLFGDDMFTICEGDRVLK